MTLPEIELHRPPDVGHPVDNVEIVALESMGNGWIVGFRMTCESCGVSRTVADQEQPLDFTWMRTWEQMRGARCL